MNFPQINSVLGVRSKFVSALGGLIAFIALTPVLAKAEAGDFWLDVNLTSKHSRDLYYWDGRVQKFNASNFGLGLTEGLTNWCDLKGGWFNNSYHKTSFYGLLNVKWEVVKFSHWSLAPGVGGGLVSGYQHTPERTATLTPWGLLTLTFEYHEKFRLNLGYLPSSVIRKNAVNVMTLNVSFAIPKDKGHAR